jgi:hypothetical protein
VLEFFAEPIPPDPDSPPYRADLRFSYKTSFGTFETQASTDAPTAEFSFRRASFHNFSADFLYRFRELPSSFFRWKRRIGLCECTQIAAFDFSNGKFNSYLRASIVSPGFSVRLDTWPSKKRCEFDAARIAPRLAFGVSLRNAQFAGDPTVEFQAFARSAGLNPAVCVYGGSLARQIGVAAVGEWRGRRIGGTVECREVGLKREWTFAVAAEWEITEAVRLRAVVRSDPAARITASEELEMRLSAALGRGESAFGGEFVIDGDALLGRIRGGRIRE